MKICVFGGTFDPPHIGHLLIAQTVCEAENFDRIIEERNNLKLKISINSDQELKKKLKNLDTQYQKYKDKYDKNRHQLILDVRKNIKSLNSQN